MKIPLALLILGACSHGDAPAKKNLVLIQGFHLDEKSWEVFIEHLPREKFTVMALPRLERDGASPTLASIAEKSCETIDPDSVVVAHSFGGAIATSMFGQCPEKIGKIIYVSAVVPRNGEAPFARMTDKVAQANYQKAVTVKAQRILPREVKTFYRAMDPSVNTEDPRLPQVHAESVHLARGIVTYDVTGFKALPKAYVVTENDPVVSVASQKSFIEDARIDQVRFIKTGHFPMIASPALLAQVVFELTRH